MDVSPPRMAAASRLRRDADPGQAGPEYEH